MQRSLNIKKWRQRHKCPLFTERLVCYVGSREASARCRSYFHRSIGWPLLLWSFSFGPAFTNGPHNGTRCDIPNLIRHQNRAAIQRKSSFVLTASILWNCLPSCILSLTGKSVTKFKSQLDKFLGLFPDEPDATDLESITMRILVVNQTLFVTSNHVR